MKPMRRPLPAVTPPPGRIASTRSRVSNGGLPDGVRAQSPEGRRFVDIVLDLTAELGGELSAAEALQVRAIAGLIVHAEQLQAAVLKGEAVDSEQLVRVSNSASRLIATLKRAKAPQPRRRGQPLAAHPLASRASA